VYLKKLSVQGFKSFAARTSFEFGPGITAVVGPNGSGKSNVADAIRWVLGEQSNRLLRARRQEDVIFAGTSGRPAVGMAEAILTLDNEDRWLPVDFAEVEVGRRVYRNGESEYLLNGSRIRLRDVIDLLARADVGQNSYAIMGQGLVDEVLSMSPDDRRVFLDEAADVKRFRAKVREAQDRLAATRENMDRVALLVAEIEPRLAQLSRQAQRAAEHARLSAELSELLAAWYGHRWSEAQNALVRARAALDQRTAEDAAAAQRVDQLREQLRALGEEIRKRRDAIARRDSRHQELDQRLVAVEQAIALDRERHGMISARREEVRLEVEAIEAERMSLSSTELDEGRRGLEVVEEVEQARAYAAERREELERAEREYSAIRGRLQELRDGAEGDDRRAAAAQVESESAERRLKELDGVGAQAGAARRTLLAQLVEYGRQFRELQAQVADAEEGLAEAREAAAAARAKLQRLEEEVRAYAESGSGERRELDRLEGRLEALERIYTEHESVAAGTRNVLIMGQALLDDVAPGSLGENPEVTGVRGLLSRHIRVPTGLEIAINAALEHRLHAVVIDRESEALNAIELLRARSQGRAQFLPLDSVRHVYPLNLQKERGVLGVAAKLVRCEGAYRQLVDTLLGRVIVCEDVQTARRMVKRGLGSVVTLDGTLIEQGGSVSGGATAAEESIFSGHRELEELPGQIADLRRRTTANARQLEVARASVEHAVAEVAEAEAAHEEWREHAERARVALDRQRERLLRLRGDMAAWQARAVEAGREAAEQYRARATALAELEEARKRSMERREAIEALQAELQKAVERREVALRAVAEASSRLAGIEGERRALEAMREQHEKALERLATQIAAKKLQGRNLELEASVIDERLGKLARELEALRLERSRQADDEAPDRDELHRFENHERQVQEEYANAQAALLEVDRRRLDVEAEVARAQDHIESLRAEMDREGLAPDRLGNIVPIEQAMTTAPLFGETAATAPPVQGGAIIDVEETRGRIEELRRQIRRLGPINEEAPEDYDESKERYEFLTTQMRDLEEAEGQLRAAIAELNEEVRTRFGVTFEKVNQSFGEYFTAFFGGGSARLMLANPEDPAGSGVEIEAQPPGKRINNLSMLSGGERSLTAVALLFALLASNPAPFCVLDEVDAALDEANVGRFTDALRELAQRTQFVIITHNRRTIEVADAIYGVSMGRDGVSKLLSLRLSDLAQN
jgi:chromosome segregation protein